jgi:hypothetical protein
MFSHNDALRRKTTMKRLLALALAPLILLAACGEKPAAAPPPADTKTVATSATSPGPQAAAAANFQHDPKLDAFGYYFTDTPVQHGNWKLKSLNIASPSDFTAWEDGKRPSNFGPIFLEFEDVTSPTSENELGQTYHTASFRLMPDSYRVDGHEVVFRANDARVGEVVLSGMFDVDALKAAKIAGPPGEPKTVLTGELQVGAERIRNIGFIYFAGD